MELLTFRETLTYGYPLVKAGTAVLDPVPGCLARATARIRAVDSAAVPCSVAADPTRTSKNSKTACEKPE